MALARAGRGGRDGGVLRRCFGVAFFGTPHQGSSYLAMPSLASSIQSLLQLSHPLPSSMTYDLRVGNSLLQSLDEDFKTVAGDIVRIWTFYETIDSRLWVQDVFFTAPLTSVKSAVLGMRQETIVPLQSDHANMASFGRHNVHTMHLFLRQLAELAARAEQSLREGQDEAWAPSLEQKVHLEVHGFFDDEPATLRAWSTRLPLRDFAAKGLEGCLSERLNEAADEHPEPEPAKTMLQGLQDRRRQQLSSPASPPTTRHSSPLSLMRADREQDMVVDRLSPPLRPRVGRSISRSFSLGSDGRRDLALPLRSQSMETTPRPGGPDDDDDDDVDAGLRLPEGVLAAHGAFAKPRVKARRFVWIHVPYNNPTWVKSVLQTLQSSQNKDLSALYNQDFWATRHTRGRHAQHYAFYAKPGCYFVLPLNLSPPTLLADVAVPTVLFLPYLHFDTYKRLLRRRQVIQQRLSRARARPVPLDVAASESLELQVIWEFLGHDPPINCRRTLDQYGFPSLRDTRARDDDQMLYKLTKERGEGGEGRCCRQTLTGSGEGSRGSNRDGSKDSNRDKWAKHDAGGLEDQVLNGNVLMVDQLWLWILDSHTLLSCFPRRESDAIEGPLYCQADLRDSIFGEVNVDLTRQCDNALDLAALAALHAVSVLLDRASHPDLEVFRIFEEAISTLNENLTCSLKDFRVEGFRDKAFDYEPVENKPSSIRARHQAEGRRAERENRDSTSALLELRDIEDELLTLGHLFDSQTLTLQAMHSTYERPELRSKTARGRGFLTEALGRLRAYTQAANDMLARVRATRDDYDKLLQMVQRQAQVDEVRISRLHADLASAQGRSVMIFTTYTVIFLPLTFFTGLFGMNTAEWGGGNNLSLYTICSVAVPGSAALVALSLVLAFSTRARRVVKGTGRVCEQGLEMGSWALGGVVGVLVGKMRELGILGRGEGEEEEGRRRRRKGVEREASDFWERHKLEREKGYEIPEKNRARRGEGGRGF
ncbi:hypothetical protein CDD81_4356 [Ophiocordyceps australis]|uniref:Uncharacterized protein n=1 Tax=Ophiocordyceps australis TaxID=1399860 RepID=A0A2C5XDQ4_9HYPO|nr:hypothetical protein CDD81_4356 [Ophiocordyceps australis]